MGGFNEGETERKLFGLIVVCCVCGGVTASVVSRHYHFAEWVGLLLSMVLTVIFLVLCLVVMSLLEK